MKYCPSPEVGKGCEVQVFPGAIETTCGGSATAPAIREPYPPMPERSS
jgi:hypothetical protein